jgi:hypothetical protein
MSDEKEKNREHKNKAKNDKIFNNKYNSGEGLTESEEYTYVNNISVSKDYSDVYLKDLYDYENELDVRVILDFIFSIFKEDSEISKILKTSPSTSKRIKLTKESVNFIFNKLHNKVQESAENLIFYSPIYILEVISCVASLEYKKLFDMLDTEIQEILLIELNEKYKFLDGNFNRKRIH